MKGVRARWPCSELQRMRYTSPTLPNRKRSGVSATPSPKSDRRACKAHAVTVQPAIKLGALQLLKNLGAGLIACLVRFTPMLQRLAV